MLILFSSQVLIYGVQIFSRKKFVSVTFMMMVNQLKRLPTWQLGERRSHKRIVQSIAPDKNVSSIGDMHNDTTLKMKNKMQ